MHQIVCLLLKLYLFCCFCLHPRLHEDVASALGAATTPRSRHVLNAPDPDETPLSQAQREASTSARGRVAVECDVCLLADAKGPEIRPSAAQIPSSAALPGNPPSCHLTVAGRVQRGYLARFLHSGPPSVALAHHLDGQRPSIVSMPLIWVLLPCAWFRACTT